MITAPELIELMEEVMDEFDTYEDDYDDYDEYDEGMVPAHTRKLKNGTIVKVAAHARKDKSGSYGVVAKRLINKSRKPKSKSSDRGKSGAELSAAKHSTSSSGTHQGTKDRMARAGRAALDAESERSDLNWKAGKTKPNTPERHELVDKIKKSDDKEKANYSKRFRIKKLLDKVTKK